MVDFSPPGSIQNKYQSTAAHEGATPNNSNINPRRHKGGYVQQQQMLTAANGGGTSNSYSITNAPNPRRHMGVCTSHIVPQRRRQMGGYVWRELRPGEQAEVPDGRVNSVF